MNALFMVQSNDLLMEVLCNVDEKFASIIIVCCYLLSIDDSYSKCASLSQYLQLDFFP